MSSWDYIGHWLEKVIELELFKEVELEDLGNKTYKHQNILFDLDRHYTPDIYIFEEDNIDIMKDRRKNSNSCILVFGMTIIDKDYVWDELPDYEEKWFRRGKWVDYLYSYAYRLEKAVVIETARIKEIERQKKLQEEEAKKQKEMEITKKFEKYF